MRQHTSAYLFGAIRQRVLRRQELVLLRLYRELVLQFGLAQAVEKKNKFSEEEKKIRKPVRPHLSSIICSSAIVSWLSVLMICTCQARGVLSY